MTAIRHHLARLSVALVVGAAAAGCGSPGGEVAEPGIASGPAVEGAALVRENGCQSCHSTSGGDGVGPTWVGLAGSEVPLKGGTTVTADEEYLRRSIADPSADIVEGFPDLMPSFRFSDEELDAIVAYIESLGE